MSGPQFFETRMGHTFYDGTMPRLVKALERLADRLATEDVLDLLRANLHAWEGEEDSVRAEHADLIARTAAAVARLTEARR